MAATQTVTTDQILDALAARPGVSAAELADAARTGPVHRGQAPGRPRIGRHRPA